MHKVKKSMITAAAIAVAVTTALTLASCDGTNAPEEETPITYAVTYALVGGTGTIPTQSPLEAGKTFALASADEITRAGYTFDGWNDGFAVYSAGDTYTMPAHDVTFTAQWKAQADGAATYTVTYALGDGATGAAPTQSPLEAGKTFALASADGISKSGYTFDGWSDGTRVYDAGDTYTMPAGNVTLTAQWRVIEPDDESDTVRIIYVYNLGGVSHGGNVEMTRGEEGETVKIADGNAYSPEEDYMFLGWTTNGNGPYYFTDGAHDGQYSAGDEITLGDGDVVLYAQWAKGYTDGRGQSDDKIYIYDSLIGKGLGAAILVRDGEPNKLGFVTDADDTQSGYTEVEFMFDAADGGDLFARIADGHYLYGDGTQGVYVMYDYVTQSRDVYVLATDGYGTATISEVVGSMTATRAYGAYEYDDDYDDYVFVYMDAETGEIITDDDGTPLVLYFALVMSEVPQTQFNGYFIQQGWESGSYLLYSNGELSYAYRLNLNGYGSAQWYELDPNAGTSTLISEGTYKGTDRYESYVGEWRFTPDGIGVSGFDFIINMIDGGTDYIPVYIERDTELEGLFKEADNENNTLYLDGYGSAEYTANGQTLVGYCSVNANRTLVTFVPYFEDDDGVTTGGKLYFDVDFGTMTFAVNADGYVVDDGVLVEYSGESSVIIVPQGVTEIADHVFRYDSETGFSVSHVTIAESVQSIGVGAFENNRTLHRVTFLSETPIDIDFSSANSPFRWPAGDFIIVVPEASVAAYKAAWSDCPYAIKGSEEVNTLEEFEIEDGVLVRYNKQPGTDNALDITIPDGVTAIADGVFSGLEYIRSVDLNGVTEIGDSAFENCYNLVSVAGNNIRHIGAGAFFDCMELCSDNDGTLELPDIVQIGENAFQGCISLRLVRLGENIQSIGTLAFTECNIFEADPPIFIELTGSELPQMAERIFTGNIAFRIKVQSYEVAKKFYDDPAYSTYCSSLYVQSGDEAGTYADGENLLVIDGRAMLMGSVVMIYKIEGSTITLLDYDSETKTYVTITGAISNDVISFAYGSTLYNFKKLDGNTVTYTSEDGLYTLECDPRVFDPENYENYSGTATVKFNGEDATLSIRGYNSKTILGYVDTDGKKYDITLNIGTGETFTYTKALANYYVRDITSADGSSITVHFTSYAIYVYGEIKAVFGTGDDGSDVTVLPAGSSDYYYILTQQSEYVYTFERMYKNDKYIVTLTFSQDMTTFTYSYAPVR